MKAILALPIYLMFFIIIISCLAGHAGAAELVISSTPVEYKTMDELLTTETIKDINERHRHAERAMREVRFIDGDRPAVEIASSG